MIKPNCKQCWYGGLFVKKDCTASCENENNNMRYLNPNSIYSGDKYIVKTLNNNFDVDCNLFLPNARDIDVEAETRFNVSAKCPMCNNEQVEDDKDGEGREIFTCDKCGKQFGAYWCIY